MGLWPLAHVRSEARRQGKATVQTDDHPCLSADRRSDQLAFGDKRLNQGRESNEEDGVTQTLLDQEET